MNDVTGIVVCLAVLDTGSQRILMQNATLPAQTGGKMIAAFPDSADSDLSSTPPKLMAASWQTILTGPGFAGTVGMPPLAASQVRIYQRLFSLNNQ